MRRLIWTCTTLALALLLGAASQAWGATAHTNPLNLDPLVKDAFSRFYLLDFPGAIERFQHFHQAHPGDPHATALLLDAMVFQELYRLDMLDTTFYAHEGFLTGRHAVEEDRQMRDRIFAVADEVVREADSRLSGNSKDVDALFARGWAL